MVLTQSMKLPRKMIRRLPSAAATALTTPLSPLLLLVWLSPVKPSQLAVLCGRLALLRFQSLSGRACTGCNRRQALEDRAVV